MDVTMNTVAEPPRLFKNWVIRLGKPPMVRVQEKAPPAETINKIIPDVTAAWLMAVNNPRVPKVR